MIICCGLSVLDSYADHLPGWIPAYIVVGALGFNAKGIDRAVEDLKEGHTFGQQSLRMFTRRGNSRHGQFLQVPESLNS